MLLIDLAPELRTSATRSHLLLTMFVKTEDGYVPPEESSWDQDNCNDMFSFLDSLACPSFIVGPKQEVTFCNNLLARKLDETVSSREDCYYSLNKALQSNRVLNLALSDVLAGNKSRMRATIQLNAKFDRISNAILIGQTSVGGHVTGVLCMLEDDDEEDEEYLNDVTVESDLFSEGEPVNHHLQISITQNVVGKAAGETDRVVARIRPIMIADANVAIFRIEDSDKCMVYEMNAAAAGLLGYSAEDNLTGISFVDSCVVESMRDVVREIVRSVARGGKSVSRFTFDATCRRSGEIKTLISSMACETDTRNGHECVTIIVQDITVELEHDREVASMVVELRQLIDCANIPIFGVDCDCDINEWNEKTEEITGYQKEESFDINFVDHFVVPKHQESVRDVIRDALAGQGTENFRFEIRTKTNDIRHLLGNATTRCDAEDNVIGMIAVAQDVTEFVKQEAKVETERNMTAYFAHELRNPLGAIDSALSVMPDDLPDAATSLVDGMKLCSQFMAAIMNNLLDVRKMEEGKMTLNQQPLSLSTLLRNVHSMLLPSLIPGVSFNMECNIRAEEDWVLGDSHRIQQVLTNVITNAIKYTISGSITISLRWDENQVLFKCEDTGPGIPTAEQARVFERFVMRGGAPGTGLGLAIAKHIVDLAGGTILFQSDPQVGPGTSCIVKFPAETCKPNDTAPSGRVEVLEQKLAILIVDDIKMNRSLLRRRFEKAIAPNSVIDEACTGEEALAVVAEKSFDIIIMDQFMEEAGGTLLGTDVVHAMRQKKIDAIIIGCSGNDFVTDFLKRGADWVWQKPIPSNEAIIQRIKQALSERTPSSS